MDRIRVIFDSMMKSEWYSRLTQGPAENRERPVEVELSGDGVEEEDQAEGFQSLRPAAPPYLSRHKICFLVLGILLMFVTGYLLGSISQGQPQEKLEDCEPGANLENMAEERQSEVQSSPEVQLNWKDIAEVLKHKLTSKAFDVTLQEFDLPERSTGSKGDMHLANKIFDEFKKLDMDPWTDIHNISLPIPDRERPNRILFGSSVFEPTGYLAYSHTGKVQGRLVYGNYGRLQDLDILLKNNIEVKGGVLLLRTGKISFAELVDNAATRGACAVLVYPDTKDYNYNKDTPLYGHVHLGLGDPYTPGFPSFDHSQFPPTLSSGLPKIPAQTITASNAATLLQNIGGPKLSSNSSFIGGLKSVTYRLGGQKNITVEVNNVLVNKELRNVFGVIKGFADSDRCVVLGAQRDAWGKGYTKATIGTSVLMELAKAVRDMVEKGQFRPRRSLVFASWSAGEYGNIGATEWLKGYMSSIDKAVFTYISLDGVVMGFGSFLVSASPLLHSLLESTMKEVQNPFDTGSLYDMMGKSNWAANVMRPMLMDDPAYPFLAFSGIPSVSFHFISKNIETYIYYGTNLDNRDHLNYNTNHQTSKMTSRAAQFAGLMALRLTHSQLLRLDLSQYSSVLSQAVFQIYKHISYLNQSGELKDMDPTWLNQAWGSCQQAAESIMSGITNTDLNNKEAYRILNDRIKRSHLVVIQMIEAAHTSPWQCIFGVVTTDENDPENMASTLGKLIFCAPEEDVFIGIELTLLSPYVSPLETPFRHLLWGRGAHTLASMAKTSDMEQLRIQLALATWTIQRCANAMAGDIWDINVKI